MHLYILEEKNVIPCDVFTWNKWMRERPKDKVVFQEQHNSFKISTVFLGVNHPSSSEDNPIVFETMIFDRNGNDIYVNRYSTCKEAEMGHNKAKKWLLKYTRNGCKENRNAVD